MKCSLEVPLKHSVSSVVPVMTQFISIISKHSSSKISENDEFVAEGIRKFRYEGPTTSQIISFPPSPHAHCAIVNRSHHQLTPARPESIRGVTGGGVTGGKRLGFFIALEPNSSALMKHWHTVGGLLF